MMFFGFVLLFSFPLKWSVARFWYKTVNHWTQKDLYVSTIQVYFLD